MREASKTAAVYTIVLINRILSGPFSIILMVAQAPDAGSAYVSCVVAA